MSNSANNESDYLIFGTDNPVARRLQVSYLVISVVLSVVCGLLVIVLVWTKDYLQKPCHYLRCNLALDDILLTGFYVPTVIHNINQGYNSTSVECCRVEAVLVNNLLLSKTFAYLLIAAEVYFFTIHPLHYNDNITANRVGIAVTVSRTTSLCLSVVCVAVGVADTKTAEEVLYIDACTPLAISTSNPSAMLTGAITLLISGIVLLTIGFMYYRVLKEARQQQDRDENRHMSLHETRAFRTLAPSFAIVLVFVLSNTVCLFFVRLANSVGKETTFVLLVARRVSLLLAFTLSPVTDSVFYSLNQTHFRKALREVFPKIYNRIHPETTTNGAGISEPLP